MFNELCGCCVRPHCNFSENTLLLKQKSCLVISMRLPLASSDSVSSITRSPQKGHLHRLQEVFTTLEFHTHSNIIYFQLFLPTLYPPAPSTHTHPIHCCSHTCLLLIHPQNLFCFPSQRDPCFLPYSLPLSITSLVLWILA